MKKIFKKVNKLKKGDKIAIISPSFGAPAQWPEVFEIGLTRLKQEFGLEPVLFPSTTKKNVSTEERARDILAAFSDPQIKGVMATLGGNDQVTYIKALPEGVFKDNPKPFFGFSDNTHLINHLWLCGVPSYYGASLFTQIAMPGKIDSFTKYYLDKAFFKSELIQLQASTYHSEYSSTNWDDVTTMDEERSFIDNLGWHWDGHSDANGITWGGCLESIDEILRHGIDIPDIEEFKDIVLVLETSEEVPDHSYVFRVLRALGERGFLGAVNGVLVGRPDTFSLDSSVSNEWREEYRTKQIETVLDTVRRYSQSCPIIQNLDIGHTHPQIALPIGREILISSTQKSIQAYF